jgi:hypothetical protein
VAECILQHDRIGAAGRARELGEPERASGGSRFDSSAWSE